MKKPRKSEPLSERTRAAVAEAFDQTVKTAVFTVPAGASVSQLRRHRREAQQTWAAYEKTSGSDRLALGRVLTSTHEPQYVRHEAAPGGNEAGLAPSPDDEDSEQEHPLGGVAHARRRAPDVAAGFLETPGRGVVRAGAGSEPTIHINATNRELMAALALQELAASVISFRVDRHADPVARGRVIAAYRAAFGGMPLDHPPWTRAVMRVLENARDQLRDLQATAKWSGSFAEELCFRPAQVVVTRSAQSTTLEVRHPRGATLEVASHHIRDGLRKRHGAPVSAELEGHPSDEVLDRFAAVEPHMAVVRTVESESLAIRRLQQPAGDVFEVVAEEQVGDYDLDVRLIHGPRVGRWQRVAPEDTEPAVWVHLSLEEALRYRRLTAPQLLETIRVRVPRWDPLPNYIDDADVLAWLLMKLGSGRGGGRNGGLSREAVRKLLTLPQELIARIEHDAEASRVSPERREHLRGVAQRVVERAPVMFGPWPERPTPGCFPDRADDE
jgi:hypothetical protein